MILLTGASGSLGSRLKHDKSLEVRFPTSSKDLQNKLKGSANHTLIHLAGASSRKFVDNNEDYAYKINVESTISLFKALAENQGKRFIFASSGHVYGDTRPDYFSVETDELKPKSTYAKQKLIAENMLLNEASNYDTQLIILRIFSIFGNGMRDHYLSGMIEKSTEKNTMPLIATCDDERDFSSPEVVAGYIEKFQKNSTPKILIVNICSGIAKTVREKVQDSYPMIPEENYLRGNSDVARLVGDNKLLKQYL